MNKQATSYYELKLNKHNIYYMITYCVIIGYDSKYIP